MTHLLIGVTVQNILWVSNVLSNQLSSLYSNKHQWLIKYGFTHPSCDSFINITDLSQTYHIFTVNTLFIACNVSLLCVFDFAMCSNTFHPCSVTSSLSLLYHVEPFCVWNRKLLWSALNVGGKSSTVKTTFVEGQSKPGYYWLSMVTSPSQCKLLMCSASSHNYRIK